MKKYAISKEFGFYAYLRPPMYKPLLPILQKAIASSHQVLYKDPDIAVGEHRVADRVQLFSILPKSTNDKLPCLLFYHGGAFAFPAYRHHYLLASRYAKELPCAVVFVNYRLMPQYRYPAQLEDALDALVWVRDHASDLSVDRQRIAVCGDSAGGQLAAYAACRAEQRFGIRLSFQMLIYPALDDKMRTASMARFSDTPLWNSRLNRRLWKWYLEGKEGGSFISLLDQQLPPWLPPAYVETAEFDCLRDEGNAYGEKLARSGVPVTFLETSGTMHGFEVVNCPTTESAIQSRLQFIRSVWEL